MVLQSGTALDTDWGPIRFLLLLQHNVNGCSPEAAARHGLSLAAALDCPAGSLECLQNKTVEQVLTAGRLDPRSGLGQVFMYKTVICSGREWMPVPDSQFTSSPFLPDTPENLLQAGTFNTEVQVMLGLNKA